MQMSHKEQEVYFSLLNQERKIVTIKHLTGMSEGYARKLLFNLSRKKALYRIAKGCYILIPSDMIANPSKFINDPCIIMDQLMGVFEEKYYVGYQSAAYLHGIAEQIPFTVSVAIQDQRRPLRIGSQKIEFRKVSTSKFFGIERMNYSGSFLNVSDFEKTIIDCLERYDLCGGIDEVTRTISNAVDRIDGKRLIEYLGRVGSKPLWHRLGFILDKLFQSNYKVNKKILFDIYSHLSNRIYPLDPKAGSGGLSKKWKIVENVNCVSWLHA